ncbi:MAG TPA: hypothetical protein VLL50_03275, partial [Usitatibacter sp.]|nr:hypothetical protein [Usitatibacter sp.]
MRASIVRQFLATVAVLVAIGVALTWMTGGGIAAVPQLGWAVVLAVGIAAFTAWQKLSKIKGGFVAATNPQSSIVAVDRAGWPSIDWKSLDDYAIQLEARGYRRLGDFSLDRHPGHARGMARYLADGAGTQIVELQQFERIGAQPQGSGPDLFEVRVAISSIVAGCIRVMVSDRALRAVNYVIRDRNAVYAAYPGKQLLELVDLHRRLCDLVTARTGRPVDAGYTLERYVLLSRERSRLLRERLESTSAWTILGEIDRFNADPVAAYSMGEAQLKAVKARSWEEIDGQATSKPAILSAPPRQEAAAAPSPAADALRSRMVSGAHWFYWIAGLSAVNAVSSAMGSAWGFVVSLGASEILGVAAKAMAGKSSLGVAIAWSLNAAVIG